MKELLIEEKELLFRDLSARLPYGVKVQTPVMNDEITLTCGDISAYFFNPDNKLFLKPYLRPMSSMTEEEKREYNNLCFEEEREMFEFGEWVTRVYYHDTVESIDWLNKKMFAYRTIDGKDMFELGLALAAPEGMYK